MSVSYRHLIQKSIQNTTPDEEDYEDEGATRPVGDLLYDEDEDASNDEEPFEDDEGQTQPFSCPFNCRCKFNKVLTAKEPSDEYEDAERFRIEVECPDAGLGSLANLFDEDFPLGQIVFL